jgi:hypothetical protein
VSTAVEELIKPTSRTAVYFACENCGHLHWFLPSSAIKA